MIFSLNEIEALSREAARGGGMSWGLAEEAGKAVRWLGGAGFPGPWLLAELLRQNDGRPYSDLAPRRLNGSWRARTGLLCPIVAGALICDRADELEGDGALRLRDVAVPLLLAPFAREAACAIGRTVVLQWRGASLVLGNDAPKLDGDAASLTVAAARSVALLPAGEQARGAAWTSPGRLMSPETLRALEMFALRTYAPATEASRAGAGAGRNDD